MSTTTPHLRLRILLAALAGFLAAVPLTALALAARAGAGPITRLDTSVAQSAHDLAKPLPWLVRIADVVDVAFSPWVFRALVALTVVYLWRKGATRLAWWAGISMATASVLGLVLKLLVGRARPVFGDPLGHAAGYSFPSGHALNSMAGVLILVLVALPAVRRPWLAWTIGAIVVLVVGADRIVLGVHYLSDVVAGWIAGLAVVLATAAGFESWRRDVGRRRSAGAVDGIEPEAAAKVRPRRPWIAWTAALVAAWYAVLVISGSLLAGWGQHEDGIDRNLAAHRSGGWTAVSLVFSTLASTWFVVGTCAVIVVVFRFVLGRWREGLTAAAAVALQAMVFLLTTAAVDRVRPAVPKLDPAPPTSSVPSGHTGAATALYVGVALLIASRVKPVWLKVLVLVLAALVPISVGLARLYRGMHHPTDVAFGAANGLFCALLVTRASAKQAAE
ncbi:MAG: hypothetical protein QOI35_244 [Cryptosporangiaceae bacterium]|nr:hypothetical protein [Cryptosporangiaceae bacterium]